MSRLQLASPLTQNLMSFRAAWPVLKIGAMAKQEKGQKLAQSPSIYLPSSMQRDKTGLFLHWQCVSSCGQVSPKEVLKGRFLPIPMHISTKTMWNLGTNPTISLPHSPNSQNGTLPPPPPTHPFTSFTSMACRLSIKLGDDTTKVDSHAIQNITRIANAVSIVRSIWLSWIKVLNCLKCQHVHKSSQSSQSCHLRIPTTSMEVADLYYTLCNLSRRPSTIEMHHWLHLQSFTPASFSFTKHS